MFVKWDCGCIGDPTVRDSAGKDLVVKACDNDRDAPTYCFFFRDQAGKAKVPLTPEQQAEILVELNTLLMDGYTFRDVRRALRIG